MLLKLNGKVLLSKFSADLKHQIKLYSHSKKCHFIWYNVLNVCYRISLHPLTHIETCKLTTKASREEEEEEVAKVVTTAK